LSTIEIPNKSHFKTNEVCGLTGVKPYVLRFWEAEFDQIAPINSSSGQKLFVHSDIEAIAVIKKLLFEDKKTIEAAKAELPLILSGSAIANEGEEEEAYVSIRGLDKADLENLDLVKEGLHKILRRTSELKQIHSWS
jgi:DNA-binding transcriptional MerR regulator